MHFVAKGAFMSHPISPNWFDQTPDSAYLRERQLVGDKKDPTSPRLLPISRATLWRMVRDKRFPAPHKLGPNTTAWRCGDVRAFLRGNASCDVKLARVISDVQEAAPSHVISKGI